MAAIVQAIVNKSGWQSGNALVILVETADTDLMPGAHRRVFAYEREKTITNTARLVVHIVPRKVYLPLVVKN